MADVTGYRSLDASPGAHAQPDASRAAPDPEVPERGVSRRRFIGYLIAGPTLIAGAEFGAAPAMASIPTIQPVDSYDLTDLLTDATRPTANLIRIVIHKNGTVSFALPRAEVGQGITTAVAMTIADEIGVPLDKVNVTLSDARPALVWNQITGGSNTMHSIYTPVRVAAAVARGQLLTAAGLLLDERPSALSILDGVIHGPGGKRLSLAKVAHKAAVTRTTRVATYLKPQSQLTLVGTPQRRVDALAIVTGRKKFAMDLEIEGALPTMVCRPPTINGSVRSVANMAAVKNMPGITDVAVIPHTTFVPGGVAVRGRTFGQCIDAIRALNVTWNPGPVAGLSDTDVQAQLKKSELPLTPALPVGKSLQKTFTFHFRPGDPLETNCAVAHVTKHGAEVWSSLKTPIWAQEQLAVNLGLPVSAVKTHVTHGGGSFGRHLFADAAFEAAAISQKMGKPVKLMWHRTDNFRQGRVHPMATSTVRLKYLAGNVLSFDQRHTSVATDFSHGFGEILTALGATPPGANSLGYSQTIFNLTANVPYNFGAVTQLLNEAYAYTTFNTSSVRNIYSPDVCTATEVMVDLAAVAMGQDPYKFRRAFVRDARAKAVLDKVAQVGNWGRKMAPGTAQGIAIHNEYKGRAACLVEIDCTPATVNRTVTDGFTGPRVTKVVFAVDVGLPINPLGLQAQMMGGIMDGIAQALTYSLHFKNGHYLEGSWDNAYYTRQWNTPLDVQVIVMPPTTSQPGGAGEFGVAAAMAAVANAYGRATGTYPTSFPINYNQPLGFTPLPTVPSIPPSPTDGLQNAF